ncbi:hypothetical protein [Blastopirellula retiformator]|uniref:Uncharacterized protein n=1 Tax=Blastopirellula retiformator TaxID=2527970 RepID=A0A5C5V6M6_9BACT|nr:hypothetical protein [Blastopirellula retiformator]TWT34218.1 hypothetical protein Enr8_16120 [Blastopirellula retiformator]
MTDLQPFETDLVYCPNCDEDRFTGEFDFVGLVEELGNIPRFRCKKCGKEFETLPPNVIPKRPEVPPSK